MDISVLDAGNYFRGLLLLIRQDRVLRESEIRLMQRVGRSLGFERTFCENAIRDILENPHVSTDPPVFASGVIAEMFVIDGLRIALTGNEIHPLEEEWLKVVADANGLRPEWFQEQKLHPLPGKGAELSLEVESLTVRPGK